MIIFGTVIVSIPIIFGLGNNKPTPGEATGLAAFIWPFIFLLGFLFAAFKNTMAERTLKAGNKENKVHLIYFLFWSSLFQLTTATLLFWTDIIPFFGMSGGSFQVFWQSMKDGVYFTFNNPTAFVAMIIFITSYVITYLAGNDLLRYDKGATWLAVVTTFVTPLGIIWWNFFDESPFKFDPHFELSDLYVFTGAAIMLGGGYLYKVFEFKNNKLSCDNTDEE